MTTVGGFINMLAGTPRSWWRGLKHDQAFRTVPLNHRPVFCPLTAVCYHETGKVYTVDEAFDAAHDLGLTYWEARDIIYAADVRSMAEHPNSLRVRLLQAIKLKRRK